MEIQSQPNSQNNQQKQQKDEFIHIPIQLAKQKRYNFIQNYLPIINPIKHYYQKKNIPYLIKPNASYKIKQDCQFMKGRNASINKQFQFLRGNIKQSLDFQVVENILKSQKNSLQILNKRKNCSFILEQTLFYSYQNQLRAISFQTSTQQILKYSNNQRTVAIFQTQILQLMIINYNYQIIGIRTKQKFTVLNIFKKEKVIDKHFKGQILSCSLNCFKQNFIDISFLDNKGLIQIVQINCLSNNDIYDQLLSTRTSVIDHYRILGNQMLFCSDFSLGIIDFRHKKQAHHNINFNHLDNSLSQRIYAMISFSNQNENKPYFCLSSSFHLGIFDVRKINSPILKCKHMCQQAPPNCLQFINGNKIKTKIDTEEDQYNFNEFIKASQRDLPFDEPLLVAHSSYKFGTSLFTTFNLQNIKNDKIGTTINQIFFNQINRNHLQMQMLYDSGKIINQVYPRSISVYQNRPGSLLFFHTDSHGGVSMQNFVKNQFQQKFVQINMQTQLPTTKNMQQIEFDLQYQKFEQEQIERYLQIQENIVPEIKIQKSENDLQIDIENQLQQPERSNVLYCDMKRFLQKINLSVLEQNLNKNKQIKPTMEQDQNSIDEKQMDAEIIEDQSQNSQNEQQEQIKQINGNESGHLSRQNVINLIRGNFNNKKAEINVQKILEDW